MDQDSVRVFTREGLEGRQPSLEIIFHRQEVPLHMGEASLMTVDISKDREEQERAMWYMVKRSAHAKALREKPV